MYHLPHHCHHQGQHYLQQHPHHHHDPVEPSHPVAIEEESCQHGERGEGAMFKLLQFYCDPFGPSGCWISTMIKLLQIYCDPSEPSVLDGG